MATHADVRGRAFRGAPAERTLYDEGLKTSR
jgi:hypothetical protein